MRREGETSAAQIDRGLTLALCRPAQPDEVTRGLALLDTLTSKHGLTEDRALELFCLMTLNLNEFVYLD